ncbi:MAG: glycosyltransferase family 4 protein [Desulfobacca sp.]|uniref:glycosyltransferase family 4 protein n=1 Tax=Desulfobacca sp. TaxID=2067990 RepID=UPI00404AC3CE
MRLALIRQRLNSLGGAETTLLALTRELLRQGHEVVILSADDRRPPALAGLGGCQWLRVPRWPGTVGRILGFAINARRLVRKSHFDLVYSLERTLAQDAYRAGDGCHREWLARRRPYDSLPQRLWLSLSPSHRTLLLLEKRLFGAPDLRLVIANSRQVQEEIQRHYQVRPEKIQVIYNGVDHQRFQPQPWPSHGTAPTILFVGSGFKRKGLAFLIRAFAVLTHRQAQLLVVGQGRPRAYQRLAWQLGVTPRLAFLGPQPQVERFYARANVLALPTLYDPCANVVLEALACGRPVITTAANGAAEFIQTGGNGAVLARADDVAGLAAALAEFLERGGDPAVQQAAVAAVADLSWPRTVAETLAALETVARP